MNQLSNKELQKKIIKEIKEIRFKIFLKIEKQQH